MLVFEGFVSCLRRTRRCGDGHEAKPMNAMIVKSGEFLFRDLGFTTKYLSLQVCLDYAFPSGIYLCAITTESGICTR